MHIIVLALCCPQTSPQIMQRNHYRRLLRAGKLQEPQPYLEPRSPRSKVSSHGGELFDSVEMQALGLEGVEVTGEGGEPGASGGAASGEGGASGECVTVRLDEEEVKVKPAPGTLYADLGEFEPVNLLSFAYQIASGMVGHTRCMCV